MAACEVLPWPDCRGPSNTITHPTPYWGLDLKSVKCSSFGVFIVEGISNLLSGPLNNGQRFSPEALARRVAGKPYKT